MDLLGKEFPVPWSTSCKLQIGTCLRSLLPEAAWPDPCPASPSHGELISDPILKAKGERAEGVQLEVAKDIEDGGRHGWLSRDRLQNYGSVHFWPWGVHILAEVGQLHR